MRILLIEDEKKMAGFIVRGLKEQHYVVDVASDGKQGLFLAETNPYDLLILDLMLPDQSGLAICKELRSKKITTPILMLTAKDTVKDKVVGLNVGADDYLTKPFAFEEFLARVGVLLRRKDKSTQIHYAVADLEIDLAKRQVKRAGKEIVLTSKEFTLLEYLMHNTGQVVTRTMISEHVWHEDFDSFTNVVDVTVNHLRNKIDKDFSKPLLHTIRGSGYILKK